MNNKGNQQGESKSSKNVIRKISKQERKREIANDDDNKSECLSHLGFKA